MIDAGVPPAVPAVDMRGITKRFAHVVANDRVDLTVRAGEIHAVVGENGAGKSTLMRILGGLTRPDRGEIVIRGETVQVRSARDARRLGIGMVHQHFMLIPPFTVAENVALGDEGVGALMPMPIAHIAERVASLAQSLGLIIDPLARVSTLSVGQQQRVEVLKLLYRDSAILVLDEPTAVLAPHEVDELFRALRTLRAEGKTVILISHRLGEVLEIADRITVMRRGTVQGVVDARATTREQLAQMMVGRPVLLRVEKPEAQPGTVIFKADTLTVKDDRGLPAVRAVTFELAGGEILGIAGVDGNGQTELVEALVGLRHASGGTLTLLGKDIRTAPPRRIRAIGVSYVPADRQQRGVVADYSMAENVALGQHRSAPFAHGGWLSRRAMTRAAASLAERYDIRPPDPSCPVRALSGGNQQKVVVAREFDRESVVLICEQPTRGVDVGAIEFIHRQIIAQRDAGRAVLLISADLFELLSLADRIAVMYAGRFVDVLAADDTDERELGLLMTGAPPAVRTVKRMEEDLPQYD